MRHVTLVFALVLLPTALSAQERQVMQLPGATPQGLPFSPAVRAGNVLYLSGQIGFLPGTRELAPGGIGPQTRHAMENILRVLEASGSSLTRELKCTVVLADIAD